MNEQRVREVFSDEAFVTSLLEMESLTEVQAALKEKGVEMAEGDIVLLRDKIMELADKMQDGQELTPDQLDEAAGGVMVSTVILGVAAASVIGIWGVATAVTVGTGLYSSIKSRRW